MAKRVLLLSASYPDPEAAEPERPPPALSSDLLEEILLRVASPADLARASTACVSFRRLIADPSFLRRYRSTHPPLLLGFVNTSGFHPVEASHPSAAVARAVARTADFIFPYLPRPTPAGWARWRLCDVRNDRVLVGFCCDDAAVFDLAVCDPLSRRHLLLPPITDDILASVELQKNGMFHPMACFIPSGGIEEDTSFSVILWLQSDIRLGVLVFSSVSGCWGVSMSTNCGALGLEQFCGLVSGRSAYDCFYWKLFKKSKLIKLDMNTRQFSAFDLPHGHDERKIVIVESGRNKVAMFSLKYRGTSVDYYTFLQNGSENSHEWHLMSTIPLPGNYSINGWFRGPAEGYIFLEAISAEDDANHSVYFSLEIKSFKIETVSTTRSGSYAHPYFGFPPSMSPIRIQEYGEE